MNKPNKNQIVNFHKNGKTIQIPISELAPGCVKMQDAQTGEIFYIDSEDGKGVRLGDYKHGPFDPDVKELISEIAETFSDHYLNGDAAAWEDGFRRDENPDREIAMWLAASEVYRKVTSGKPKSLQKIAYTVIVNRMSMGKRELKQILPHKIWNHPITKEVLRLTDSSATGAADDVEEGGEA